ncbi:amidase [Polynucleobacter kasalickyi]|uniref:Amidase n=1 Tax=Polynucleobacter kasalickyi TaxID=1938817 RepID=A0A1W1Y369_9BURK|nr:amidase [Polynucleobacter kasalickyi]SMC30178.1 amidase [Polynucleobacter kasalickyi]
MPQSPITQLSAVDLSVQIANKNLSCVEVMQAYLAQIDRFNPQVNAIVSAVDSESLLQQAQEKDQELARGRYFGCLHGLPMAPKDLTATKGIATTLGSPLLKNQTNLSDSLMVERLRQSGAILIGKTNVPEFGLGSHTYNKLFGTTLNAYDLTKSAGGSSGGAAVSLALNMLPVADGSDFGGSLRNPAAWNNVYGMRPSRGRVPAISPELFYDHFSTEGPMARNVQDLAMLLSIQSGYDARVPLSLTEDPKVFTGNLETSVAGKKIAWLGNYQNYLPMEEGLLDALEASFSYFKDLQVQVEPAQVNFPLEQLWECWLVLRAFITGGKLGSLYQTPANRELMKPEAIWEIEQSLQYSAVDVYQASVKRSNWYRAITQLFGQYDYLLLPAAQVMPFDTAMDWPKNIAGKTMDTYHRWMEVVIGPTMAGLPVLAIPAGSLHGLPIGFQLIGKPQAELDLLHLGYAWQQATPYLQNRPSILSEGFRQ